MFSIIAFAAVAFPGPLAQAPAVKCPVMGSPVAANSPAVDFAGSRYTFCCAGCDKNFTKAPAKFIATQAKGGNVVGTSLFDPVSGQRLELAKAKARAAHGTTLFPFESAKNLATFRRSPARYAAVPAKESLYCPVNKVAVKSYAAASDYADHNGVRYYFCCPGCGDKFRAAPAKFLTTGFDRSMIKAPVARLVTAEQPIASTDTITKVRFGVYEAELRIPEEGLFAQEEMDIEFRVVDTTQRDAVEEGFKGVGAIQATAVMTMPSMMGMPEARPKVHREGVPGDYGIEVFFPHGGDYRIDLSLEIPNVGTRKIAFVVDVKDERPATSARALPYRLEVVDWPAHVMAGSTQELRLRVIDVKTGAVQTNFDLAHEKYFHLLIASKDLNWFIHEHPEMAPDGTWSIPLKFPAGSDYWIYGDVAPTGKGSQVLITKVSVHGPKPTWDTNLKISNSAVDGGLKGLLSTLAPVEIGRKTTLQVKLFDAKNGMPAGDTVKWLGAAGHLMIFHEDGQTVVHSHPSEDEASEARVRNGIVQFNGRFPKPGRYKVYAQFDWRGSIRTLGFAMEVK